MAEHTYIGKRVPRVDGREKVTGRARFTADVTLPGTLVGKMLGSTVPHARILRIATERARALPGVKAVITGEDAPQALHGFVETPRYPADEPMIAVDRVRYVGEPVAAVAAEDEATAQEALGLIEVEYEELPAVFDPLEAMEPDAPEIHPSHPALTENFRNIGGFTEVPSEEIDEAFATAYLVRKDRFSSQLRTHGYLEPQVILASWEPAEKLEVWTSSMGTFRKRKELAGLLDLPLHKVRVHKSRVGGAFGGKIDLFPHEYLAARLSMACGRPVRIELEREEIFTTCRHGQPLVLDLETAVDRDGHILAQRVRGYNDCGAYRGSSVVFIFLCWGFIMLPYRVPLLDYKGYCVHTNHPVRAPMRGHGAPQVRIAVEAQLDDLAEALGLDPLEIRLRNARRKGETLPNGDPVRNTGLVECLEAAGRNTEFVRRHDENARSRQGRIRKGIGLGVSAYFTGTLIYPNNSGALVKMNEDGTLQLLTGALDIGQGAETVLAQIVAEELGVPLDWIEVVAADTDTTPVDIGSWISGLTYITGNAVKAAAFDARTQLLATAAEQLEACAEDLTIEVGQVTVKGNPSITLALAEVVRRHIATNRGDPIVGKGHFRGLKDAAYGPSLKNARGAWSENYAFDAQVAEVEVDSVTGQVKVLKVLTAHDCGFPINPLLVEGQIDGQVSMAAGHALTEEVWMRNGINLNPSFLSYKLPCALELVENEYVDVLTESYELGKHFHTKEVGEGYVSAALAAIANAVHNATGVRVRKFPIRPEDLLAGQAVTPRTR